MSVESIVSKATNKFGVSVSNKKSANCGEKEKTMRDSVKNSGTHPKGRKSEMTCDVAKVETTTKENKYCKEDTELMGGYDVSKNGKNFERMFPGRSEDQAKCLFYNFGCALARCKINSRSDAVIYNSLPLKETDMVMDCLEELRPAFEAIDPVYKDIVKNIRPGDFMPLVLLKPEMVKSYWRGYVYSLASAYLTALDLAASI